MDLIELALLAFAVTIVLWRIAKKKEAKKNFSERKRKDQKLYESISKGMREWHWRTNESDAFIRFADAKDGDVLFETADLIAYQVEHFAESRTGFYFKDLNEYGLYGYFVGNDPETDVFHKYYRTDKEFKKEGTLFYDDE